MFIDTTMIKNVGGVDGLGKNGSDRGRLATKMGAIVDQDAVPVCAAFFPANQNDVTTTVDTVCSIPCNLRDDRRRKHVLVGDRGYISKTVADELRAFDMTLLYSAK